MKVNFISINLFEILNLQSKVMDKIQRGCLKMSKKMFFPILLWFLSITLIEGSKSQKIFLEMKLNLIFQLFVHSKVFGNIYFSILKCGLKLYFKQNSCFWLNYQHLNSFLSSIYISHIGALLPIISFV